MFIFKLFHFLIPLWALWVADPADPPVPAGNDPAKGAGTGGDNEDKKSYTQAQLDHMFADRAKQATQSAIGGLLQKLGLAKEEELETLVKTAKDAEAARLSDLEKAQKELNDHKVRADKAEADAQQAITLANTRLMESAVLVEASNPEYKFRQDALKDVWAFVDRSKLKVEDDGSISGVDEAVKAVVKAKPYMVQQATGPTGPGTPPRQRTVPSQGQPVPNAQVPEQTYEAPLVRL